MKISGKTFVVTGDASGLGAATVEALVNREAKVVVADLNPDVSSTLNERYGCAVKFVQADVTSEADVLAAVDVACDFGGTFAGAVNCAGIAPAERINGRNGMHRLESFRTAVEVNLVGTFNVLRVVADRLIARGRSACDEELGVLISTASVSAYDGQIGQAAYAASKGGVVALTLPAARELAKHGIRVMTIAPGIMETPMHARHARRSSGLARCHGAVSSPPWQAARVCRSRLSCNRERLPQW